MFAAVLVIEASNSAGQILRGQTAEISDSPIVFEISAGNTQLKSLTCKLFDLGGNRTIGNQNCYKGKSDTMFSYPTSIFPHNGSYLFTASAVNSTNQTIAKDFDFKVGGIKNIPNSTSTNSTSKTNNTTQIVFCSDNIPLMCFGSMIADHINGTSMDDIINGRDGGDVISGNNGSDIIVGENGNDNLVGGSDDDVISGDNGSDTIEGGTGNDLIKGGSGNDTIFSGIVDLYGVSPDRSIDMIDCGTGYDVAFINIHDGDKAINCEQIFSEAITHINR